jgi:hypothetical protein
MKRIVCTIVLLLLTLTFANAQWREFPCLITGDNDYSHSTSVANVNPGLKKSLILFSDINHSLDNTGLIVELTQPRIENITISGYYESGHISIKSNQANFVKRKE